MLHTGKYWKGVIGTYKTFLCGNIYPPVVHPIGMVRMLYTAGYICVEVRSQKKNVVHTGIVTT